MYFTHVQNSDGTSNRVVHDVLEDDIGYVMFHHVEPSSNYTADQEVIIAARMSTTRDLKGDDKDKKLLRYLWEHGHLSPFEQVEIWFDWRAPIMVTQQLLRHRTFMFNQESARYTQPKEELFLPKADQWRKNDGKQTANQPMYDHEMTQELNRLARETRAAYDKAIARGIAKEQARLFLLGYAQYTSLRVKANLRNFLHMLEERISPYAQYEIRQYALASLMLVKPYIPWTYELWYDSLPDEQKQLIDNCVCYEV